MRMAKDRLNLPEEFFDQFKFQANRENFLFKIFKLKEYINYSRPR